MARDPSTQLGLFWRGQATTERQTGKSVIVQQCTKEWVQGDAMAVPQNVIAVVFDYDDTLTNDSTTQLLESKGIDPQQFWKQHSERVKQGCDPTLEVLQTLLVMVGPDSPLGALGNKDLRAFGGELECYPGIPGLFDDLRVIAADNGPVSGAKAEIYVISGGLEEIILGSEVAEKVDGVRACEFGENQSGVISNIRRAVTFTEKTRYLFEIAKGPKGFPDKGMPYEVNRSYLPEDLRVPFRNMIYVGDGLTDIPCFSVVQKGGGAAFAVLNRRRKDAPKTALQELLLPKRPMSLNAPKFRDHDDDDLGQLLRLQVANTANQMDIRQKTAYQRRS